MYLHNKSCPSERVRCSRPLYTMNQPPSGCPKALEVHTGQPAKASEGHAIVHLHPAGEGLGLGLGIR